RQLIALDRQARAHGFTGADSVAYANHITEPGIAIAGNMLERPEVLEAMLSAAPADDQPPDDRMLRVLTAAKQAGGRQPWPVIRCAFDSYTGPPAVGFAH
ncbi:DUF1028 domain-containing protein, partial [bacterium]|nr:DUF1028 domain-containing protein [bacterium]